MSRVELKQEINTRMAEHEILLSFNGDMDAAAFQDWWYAKGQELYEEYAENNDPY